MEENTISLEEINQSIEKQIQHSYLDRFIEQPVIDQKKLFLLLAVFQDTSYTVQQQKRLIVTSMLVQIALDTHDKVSLNDSVDEPDSNKKKRQLTVLAGDYYSGLYYHLLSNIEDIQMIKTLASVIKEINEAKMSVYYKQHTTVSEVLEGIQLIESLLVKRVAEYAGKKSINNFAEEWLLLNRLIKEKADHIQKKQSELLLLISENRELNLNEEEVLEVLDSMIEKQINRTKKQVFDISSQFPILTAHPDLYNFKEFVPTKVEALEEGLNDAAK